MKIVIAPDSFKGSLDAAAASRAIEIGVHRAVPEADTVLCPMADGGEGTAEALVAATRGHMIDCQVRGPLGEPVDGQIGFLGDGETCAIEMASASGIVLLPADRLNPLTASTYGTGELIKRALDLGCRKFIVGIGGSATNDGGAGMLQALGLRLLDAAGHEVGPGGSRLREITEIGWESWDQRLAECEFLVANDVSNPLIGPDGCSSVYGPQKGATPEMVEQLEDNIRHWAELILRETGVRTHELPGAGAGGGIGAALAAFLSAKFHRGIELVIEKSGLQQAMNGSDLVITGEGKVDRQTAFGKTVAGVSQEARKRGIPVFVLAGAVGEGIESLYPLGVTSVLSIADRPMSLRDAMEQAAELLEARTEQIVRAYMAGRQAR